MAEFISELSNFLFPDFTTHITGIPLIISFVFLGAMIGFLTGFLGVGGGFLITPLLNILIGVPYEIAVGSDLSFIIGTSFFSFMKQNKQKKVHIPIALCIGAGSILGTFAGDVLQDLVLFRFAGGNSVLFTVILHGVYIIMLAAIIFVMRDSVARNSDTVPLFQRRPGRFRIYLNGDSGPSVNLWLLLLTGVFLGVLTGFMGIGGGVLLVPILLLLIGLEPVQASATSILVVFISTVMGTLKKGLSGNPKISLMVTLCLLVSSFIGVQLGIHLLKKAKAKAFSHFFIYILITALVLILVDMVKNIFVIVDGGW